MWQLSVCLWGIGPCSLLSLSPCLPVCQGDYLHSAPRSPFTRGHLLPPLSQPYGPGIQMLACPWHLSSGESGSSLARLGPGIFSPGPNPGLRP